ncbi:hypothetical protein TRVL_07308 [Trypanosoma vivax]|nr:hypothetical protein TRVL_07308 [Trypanosoma vivax]
MRRLSYAVFLFAALAALCVGHSFGEHFQPSPQSDVVEYHQQHKSNEQKFDPDSSARQELLEALVADTINNSSGDASGSGSVYDSSSSGGVSGSSNVGSYDYSGNTGVGSTGGNAGNAGGNAGNTDGNGDNTGGVGSAGGDAGTGSKGSTNDGGEDNTNNRARDPDQTPKETKDTTQNTYSTESTAGAGGNSKAEHGASAVLSSGAAWFNIIMVLARAN